MTYVGIRRATLALTALFVMACGDGAEHASTGGDGGAGSGVGVGVGVGVGSGASGTAVCPGTNPWPDGTPLCRSQADCEQSFEQCGPEPVGGCGACFAPDHDCTVDADCGETGVCKPYVEQGPCLCGDPNGTKCVPRCPDTPCAMDELCGASGVCEPKPCDQGFACAADLACAPTSATADAHGCEPKPCTDGYACAAGTKCAPSASSDPHGCAPVSCTEGYACPVNTRCASEVPGHGCKPLACTLDGDCDCGVCIGSQCQPRMWICSSPPA